MLFVFITVSYASGEGAFGYDGRINRHVHYDASPLQISKVFP
jgi:hypothetical protein